MKLKKLTAACTLACATLFGAAAPAQAQISGDVIRIGIITDMSSLYADIDGPGGLPGSPNPGAHDGDCFKNRQDNCPTVANASAVAAGPGHLDSDIQKVPNPLSGCGTIDAGPTRSSAAYRLRRHAAC